MFYLSTINTKTLELLKTLMVYEEFSNIRLFGGTSLALQIGHRKSIDLDLFGELDFENIDTAKFFSQFESVKTLKRSSNINIFSIDGIKVDLVNYSYPWLADYHIYEDVIRLSDITDIAAMKLAAITGRGSKKDFIDIYFLLKRYTLEKLMEYYSSKYFDGSEYLVLKSITYFNDADKEPDPVTLEPVAWNYVKKTIVDYVREYV